MEVLSLRRRCCVGGRWNEESAEGSFWCAALFDNRSFTIASSESGHLGIGVVEKAAKVDLSQAGVDRGLGRAGVDRSGVGRAGVDVGAKLLLLMIIILELNIT